MKIILKCLKGTKDVFLIYGWDPNFRIRGYIDVSVIIAKQIPLSFDIKKQFIICIKFLMFLLVIMSQVKVDIWRFTKDQHLI